MNEENRNKILEALDIKVVKVSDHGMFDDQSIVYLDSTIFDYPKTVTLDNSYLDRILGTKNG